MQNMDSIWKDNVNNLVNMQKLIDNVYLADLSEQLGYHCINTRKYLFLTYRVTVISIVHAK